MINFSLMGATPIPDPAGPVNYKSNISIPAAPFINYDFILFSSGTVITCDIGAILELISTAKFDRILPLESLATPQRNTTSMLESTAGITVDKILPLELLSSTAGGTISSDKGMPFEFVSSVRRDHVFPFEILHSYLPTPSIRILKAGQLTRILRAGSASRILKPKTQPRIL